MRYTKAALLLFGLGLVLGFVVVVAGGYPKLERLASGLMALSLVLLPPALFADGHGMAVLAWIAARLRRRKHGKARRKPRRKPSPPAPGRRQPAARRGATRTPRKTRG